MNFQLNEYDKEVLSIQDGLKIDGKIFFDSSKRKF